MLCNQEQSELGGIRGKILFDHEGDFKDDCVVELSKVKAGELLDFLESVHKGVSVYKELS